MTTARELILRAVREASVGLQGRAAPTRTTYDIAREAGRLLEGIDQCRPQPTANDVVESFIARVTGPKVGASLDRIGSMSDLPAAVSRFMKARALPSGIAVQPVSLLSKLDWAAAELSVEPNVNDGCGVGLARWGIAETGSVVFHSSPETPILFNFLCATHIVAVLADSILRHLEDYAAAARIAGDPAPRNACLITGASGTTDIEGSLVKGAHGPRDLHIVVVDGGVSR